MQTIPWSCLDQHSRLSANYGLRAQTREAGHSPQRPKSISVNMQTTSCELHTRRSQACRVSTPGSAEALSASSAAALHTASLWGLAARTQSRDQLQVSLARENHHEWRPIHCQLAPRPSHRCGCHAANRRASIGRGVTRRGRRHRPQTVAAVLPRQIWPLLGDLRRLTWHRAGQTAAGLRRRGRCDWRRTRGRCGWRRHMKTGILLSPTWCKQGRLSKYCCFADVPEL